MGDKRRFDLFAEYIARVVPRTARIADVAAGKGYLSFALKERGFSNVTPVEAWPRRGAGGKVRRLGLQIRDWVVDDASNFDVVVGMHPDAATDVILEGCARHGKIGIVVPCCIKPFAWTYSGNGQSHAQWESHLRERSRARGLHVYHNTLPMVGANRVIEVHP